MIVGSILTKHVAASAVVQGRQHKMKRDGSRSRVVVVAESHSNSRRQVTAGAAMVDVLGPTTKTSPLSEPSCPPTYEHRMNHWNVGWFSRAVEDIVRHLDGTEASDQFVHVVTNHMNADAVILVKRIVTQYDLKTHHIAEGSSVNTDEQPPDRRDVEHACDQVLKSHGRMLVNAGHVGECCDPLDGDTNNDDNLHTGKNLETNALQPATPQTKATGRLTRKTAFHGYWGVVVQTKDRSSVEGCYLLKAGCSIVEGGCSCTHYSMTRVEQPGESDAPGPGIGGDDAAPSIHQQFVDSWRAPYL